MLSAIEAKDAETGERRTLSSLRGEVIVFSGRLSISRREAAELATLAGAAVQPTVSGETSVLVKGFSGAWKADDKGQKLLDVDAERDRGHEIHVVKEAEFLALVKHRAVSRMVAEHSSRTAQ